MSGQSTVLTGGDWSWNTVRDYWYNNVTALTDKDTDDKLERLLKGLGYQMHLIQDIIHRYSGVYRQNKECARRYLHIKNSHIKMENLDATHKFLVIDKRGI